MFSSIQGSLFKLLGHIEVSEFRNIITIKGVNQELISKEIYNKYSTSKIADNMFIRLSGGCMVFYSFYAPDVLYTLESLIAARNETKHVRTLRHIVKLLKTNTWLKDTLIDHPDILNFDKLSNLNVKLLPHQLDFLNIYNDIVPKYDLKGFLLGAAAGSGKTITSIALAETLEADVVICIVPKNSVDKVWLDTLSTRMTRPVTIWTSTGKAPLSKYAKYFVFHYEQLDKAVEFFKTMKYKKPVIILDECHNLSEITSLRTQLFIELCNILKAKHVLWMSGTPLKAVGTEVIPILYTLDDFFTDTVAKSFKAIFGKSATKANDILKNRLGLMTFRVDKKIIVTGEVNTIQKLVKIPNSDEYTLDAIRILMSNFINTQMDYYKNNMSTYVTLYNKCIEIYKVTLKSKPDLDLLNKYLSTVKQIQKNYDPVLMKNEVMFCNKYELQSIIPNLPKDLKLPFKDCRSIIKYYQLKVQGEALGRILGKLRTKCNVDIVKYSKIEDDIESAIKKTVIFTNFVEVVNETNDYLITLGYKPLLVYGDTNKNLSSILDHFKNDIDANPLIATFQSLSTAVPLIMASTAILMNAPFRDYIYEQATSRINRLGQDSTVTIVNVLLDTGEVPNISTRSSDIMEWSKEQVNAMLGLSNDVDPSIAIESYIEFIEGCKVNDNDIPLVMSW